MNNNGAKGVVAFLLCAAMLVGGGAVGYGMATDWTYEKGVQIEQPDETPDETPEDDGGMQVGEIEGNGVSLMSVRISPSDYAEYGISPMAESAQQLRATITPSNATNQQVDWKAEWVNGASPWASGKTVTDYVTVTTTTDGSLVANVECKQAFGEQVKITVTSRQNTKASASATVDYAKRVTSGSVNYVGGTSGNVNISASGSEFTYNATSTFDDNYINASSVFTPVFGTSTVEDEFTYELSVLFSEDWISALEDNGFSSYLDMFGDVVIGDSFSISVGTVMGVQALTDVGQQYVYEDYMYGSTGAFNAFTDALRSMDGKSIFTLNVVATGEHSTFKGSCDFYYNADGLAILVESVGVADTNLVF